MWSRENQTVMLKIILNYLFINLGGKSVLFFHYNMCVFKKSLKSLLHVKQCLITEKYCG